MGLDDYTILAERITVLETERTQTSRDITEIKFKLDELLTLKSRGLGAVWLVGIILVFGSGIVAFMSNILTLVGKPHI